MQLTGLKFKAVHLINRYKVKADGRGYLGLEQSTHPTLPYAYSTGHWVFSHSDAHSLLGGFVFLHDTKAKPAHFGGLIYDWQPVVVNDAKTRHRVMFHFLYTADALHANWQGNLHKQAWTGYIIDKEYPWKRTHPHGMPLEVNTGRSIKDIPEQYINELQAKSKDLSLVPKLTQSAVVAKPDHPTDQ